MVSSLATFGANAGSSAALVRVKWRRGNGRECLTLMETWSHLLTTIFLQPNWFNCVNLSTKIHYLSRIMLIFVQSIVVICHEVTKWSLSGCTHLCNTSPTTLKKSNFWMCVQNVFFIYASSLNSINQLNSCSYQKKYSPRDNFWSNGYMMLKKWHGEKTAVLYTKTNQYYTDNLSRTGAKILLGTRTEHIITHWLPHVMNGFRLEMLVWALCSNRACPVISRKSTDVGSFSFISLYSWRGLRSVYLS